MSGLLAVIALAYIIYKAFFGKDDPPYHREDCHGDIFDEWDNGHG